MTGPSPTIQKSQEMQRYMGGGRFNRTVMLSKPYLHCRIRPFDATTSTGRPDGANRDYFVNDMLTYDVIQCTNTNGFLIQTVAALPFTAGITGLAPTGSDINVNGVAYVNHVGPVAGQTILMPIGVFPEFTKLNAFVPGQATNDPWTSQGARLIAVGYRLTYTGQSAFCSGSVVVTPNKMAFNVAGSSTGVNNTELISNVYDPTQALITQQGSVPIISSDWDFNSAAFTKDSTIFRPEQSILILPSHIGREYQNRPISTIPYYVANGLQSLATNTGTANNLYSQFSSNTVGQGYNSGVIWYDNDWTGVQVAVTGITVGLGGALPSFRWDTVFCMEMTPSNASPFSRVTLKASEHRPAELIEADKAVNNAQTGVAPPMDQRPRRR